MSAVALTFEKELSALLNKHGIDSRCNTPDYLLAEFLVRALNSFALTTDKREEWFGRSPAKSSSILEQPEDGKLLTQLQAEIRHIDSLLDRRDALHGKSRVESIEYLLEIARKAQPRG